MSENEMIKRIYRSRVNVVDGREWMPIRWVDSVRAYEREKEWECKRTTI